MATEKRLIDADALIELIGTRIKNDLIKGWIYGIISEIPTVDAVEVVRCKDCYFSERANIGVARVCHYWSPLKEALAPNDGFCYRGERKDNEFLHN